MGEGENAARIADEDVQLMMTVINEGGKVSCQ